ncbi:MAG TPA: hypothetical protein VL463_26025 [Kofleriaceae bacterium]|jgi:hypothetical protein|nr:hypothetical protein [Kofleriaceae bacterium]
MSDFFRGGGFSMWIVLAFSVTALIASFRLLRDPDPKHLAAVRALTWADTFAIVTGVLSNLIAVFSHMAKTGDGTLALYQGLAESIAPAVLGASLLSLAWLIVAVAVRRGPIS